MDRIEKIRSEITTDPLARGYAGMTDAQVATDMNLVYRTNKAGVVDGYRVRERINVADFDAQLAPSNKTQNRELVSAFFSGQVNLQDDCLKQAFWTIFPAGTVSRKNWTGETGADGRWLGDDITKIKVSRGEELGVGKVRVGDVQQARM